MPHRVVLTKCDRASAADVATALAATKDALDRPRRSSLLPVVHVVSAKTGSASTTSAATSRTSSSTTPSGNATSRAPVACGGAGWATSKSDGRAPREGGSGGAGGSALYAAWPDARGRG